MSSPSSEVAAEGVSPVGTLAPDDKVLDEPLSASPHVDDDADDDVDQADEPQGSGPSTPIEDASSESASDQGEADSSHAAPFAASPLIDDDEPDLASSGSSNAAAGNWPVAEPQVERSEEDSAGANVDDEPHEAAAEVASAEDVAANDENTADEHPTEDAPAKPSEPIPANASSESATVDAAVSQSETAPAPDVAVSTVAEPDRELEAAATKIQALARGRAARQEGRLRSNLPQSNHFLAPPGSVQTGGDSTTAPHTGLQPLPLDGLATGGGGGGSGSSRPGTSSGLSAQRSSRSTGRSPGRSPRVATKASDLLFGGSKTSGDKRLDVLGLSAKEMALFDHKPKAYATLGAADVAPVIAATNEHHHSRTHSESRDALAAGERERERAEREERLAAELAQSESEAAARREVQSRPIIAPGALTGKAAHVLLGVHKSDRRASLDGRPRSASPSPGPSTSPPPQQTHHHGNSLAPLAPHSRPLSPATVTTPGGSDGGSDVTDHAPSSRGPHAHSSQKVLDKLGVTPKQLEMFPGGQSRAFTKLGVDVPLAASMLTDANKHHAMHARADEDARRWGDAALEVAEAERTALAHAPKKQTSKKAQELALGGHKRGSKVLDRLGVSAKEMETFSGAHGQKAYKKLGVFATDDVHAIHAHPGGFGTHVDPTVVHHPPEPAEPYVDPASVKPVSNAGLGKAQGVLLGAPKRDGPGEKEQARLGITRKEREGFAGPSGQKAYQKLGVFDTPATQASRRAAESGSISERQRQAIFLERQSQIAASAASGTRSGAFGTPPPPISFAAMQAQRKAANVSGLGGSKSTPTLPPAPGAASRSSPAASTGNLMSTAAAVERMAAVYQARNTLGAMGPARAGAGGKLAPLKTGPGGGGAASKWGKMKASVVHTGPAARSGPGALAAAARATAAGGLSYSNSLASLKPDPNLPGLRNGGGPKTNLFAVVLATRANASRKGVPPKVVPPTIGAGGDATDGLFGVTGQAIAGTPTNASPPRPAAVSRVASRASPAHSRNASRKSVGRTPTSAAVASQQQAFSFAAAAAATADAAARSEPAGAQ